MIIKKYNSLNESPVPPAKRDIQWCHKGISYRTQSTLSIKYRQDLRFQRSAGGRKGKARHPSKKRMNVEHTRDIRKDCLRLDSNPGLGPLVPISTPKIRILVQLTHSWLLSVPHMFLNSGEWRLSIWDRVRKIRLTTYKRLKENKDMLNSWIWKYCLSKCVCVCMCTYMYVCTYMCMHVYISVYIMLHKSLWSFSNSRSINATNIKYTIWRLNFLYFYYTYFLWLK